MRQISTAPPGVTVRPAAAMRTGHMRVAFFTADQQLDGHAVLRALWLYPVPVPAPVQPAGQRLPAGAESPAAGQAALSASSYRQLLQAQPQPAQGLLPAQDASALYGFIPFLFLPLFSLLANGSLLGMMAVIYLFAARLVTLGSSRTSFSSYNMQFGGKLCAAYRHRAGGACWPTAPCWG